MDEEDDDLYGPSETAAPNKDVKDESDGEQGDEPMDEGMESGDDEDESDSVRALDTARATDR
jgi:pre-mRNA 3'-end-processing factor FIP1